MNKVAKAVLVGCTIIIVLVLLMVSHSVIRFCEGDDVKEKKACFTEDGEEYESKGILETTTSIVVMILGGLVLIGYVIIFIYGGYQRSGKLLGEEQKEKKKISGKEAERHITQYFAEISDVEHSLDNSGNLIIPKDFITFYGKNIPYILADKEWRIIKQFEIKRGNYAGQIYTCDINLARGKDWILNGDFLYENTSINKFNIDRRKYPNYQALTQKERLMDRLIEVGNAEAIQALQEQEIQNIVRNPQQFDNRPIEQPQQLNQPIQQQPQFQKRKPWWMKRTAWQNRYGA